MCGLLQVVFASGKEACFSQFFFYVLFEYLTETSWNLAESGHS
jgi:hypothetical protein